MENKYVLTLEEFSACGSEFLSLDEMIKQLGEGNLNEEQLNEGVADWLKKLKAMPLNAKKKRLQDSYAKRVNAWVKGKAITKPTDEEEAAFWKEAEADKFEGVPSYDQKTKKIAYKVAKDVNWAAASGHNFGEGSK